VLLAALVAAAAATAAASASTSHAGWPPDQHLVMDKGPAGRSNVLVGRPHVHNWLLGGYGNDTIYGGSHGDVIWGDYHPNPSPPPQTATIHAGNGRNVIYANDTHNYVWTGTNPYTVVHAYVRGIGGVIHCESPRIVVYLSSASRPHFKLDGCRRISHYSVGY
jgi:RTX calcium-binding nonapeptide repeat (4 copies)